MHLQRSMQRKHNRKAAALGVDDVFSTNTYRYISSSSGSTSSLPMFFTNPGAFGGSSHFWTPESGDYEASSILANRASDMIGAASPFSKSLEDSILHPSYAPTSAADTAMLNDVMDATGGRTASRGLGAPSQTALAEAIAPQMMQNRQNQIANLMGAQGLAQQGQGQNLQGLLELIGLAMPQVMGSSYSQGKQSGWAI